VTFVLDASVALAWCFEDEDDDYAEDVLKTLRRRDAVVASHWGLEVCNGLLTAERRGRITAPEVARVVRLIMALPIAVDPVERSRALTTTFRLSRTGKLSSYDGAYLDLAVRLGLPLATLDRELRRAAEAEGVEHFEPPA